MIFEAIAGFLVDKAYDHLAGPAGDALEVVLADRQALAFAKAKLHSQYEPLVRPASYEHVADNLRVTKADFLEYFRQAERPTAAGLEQHLVARLRERAADWVHNRPQDDVFDNLVRDFYRAYQSYFLTKDVEISALHLINQSAEAIVLLEEIRDRLRALPVEAAPVLASHAPSDVKAFLQILNVPFEVAEESSRHLDLIVTEPSTLFPTRFYACVSSETADIAFLDGLLRRGRARGEFSHLVLVAAASSDGEVLAAAAARGIVLVSPEAFRARFASMGSLPPIVIGSLASLSLLERQSIQEVFVPPDAVVAHPGDRMEDRFLAERQPALAIFDAFLRDESQRILFVLGGYGSGKSALAAHLTAQYGTAHPEWTAAYVPLSRLSTANDLGSVVTKADHLIKATRGTPGRSVIFLDGLDELPKAMDLTEKRFNMLRILEAAPRVDKLVVMVRTSYFRGLDDFWRLFNVEGRAGLWGVLTDLMSGGKAARSASVMILREFDSHQIATYVDTLGRARGHGAGFVEEFFAEMEESDPQAVFRSMARSPLYLYLMVNSLPWRNPSVECFADVLESFVRYWLARDIEKGPSRWLLTLADRLEFVDAIAWWMFTGSKHRISFSEFDSFVTQFYKGTRGSEAAAISLDLQTTGIFSSIGGVLVFATPAFMDYFVAMRFVEAGKAPLPLRPPTAGQARIWLGFAESRRNGGNWVGLEGSEERELVAWLDSRDIDRDPRQKLELDPRGILYTPEEEPGKWSFVNSDGCKYLRAVLRESLAPGGVPLAPGEQRMLLRVGNRLGLHARAVARMVRAFSNWRESLKGASEPVVQLLYGGETMSPGDLLGLLILAVAQGSLLELRFKGCRLTEIERFLREVGGRPEEGQPQFDMRVGSDDEALWEGEPAVWEMDFGEEERGGTWAQASLVMRSVLS